MPSVLDTERQSEAAEILAKIGVELAFLGENQDTGLLPLNSLVMDLEECVSLAAISAIQSALAGARSQLDRILDGTGLFTKESIGWFNEWHPWMVSAVAAAGGSHPLPKSPAAWQADRAGAPGPPTPASLTPEAGPNAQPISPRFAPAHLAGDEPPVMLNLSQDSELLGEFHTESVELLQAIEQGVLELEENPAAAETINTIFRAFHTFKGGAALLQLAALQKLAHELEFLLDAVRQGALKINSTIIDLILAGADALKLFTEAIDGQLRGRQVGQPIFVPTRDLIFRVQAAIRGETIFSPPTEKTAELAAGQAHPPLEIQAVPSSAVSPAKPSLAAAPGVAAFRGGAVAEASRDFVKIDTAKLDALVDLVGELVIAQSMVVENTEFQILADNQLARSLRLLNRTVSQLQANTLSLRMMPIAGVFQKMTRLVRDLATQQGKQVQLLLEGEETELDRNIVEKLGDPLVHMIRNAVDHGLENPADRTAKGKAPIGTIHLSAYHQRGGIVIQIQDDGRGLDPGRLLAKARERGLVDPDAQLDESQVFDLIFLPGFSTAEKVTDLSGRGVGMDVVRRNIENLRGNIRIESFPGQGTAFKILLPLTLAIIDGLILRVGSQRYIIPTLSVRQAFRPAPGMVTTVNERGEVVGVHGQQTPVLRLGHYLGDMSPGVAPDQGILVVVESGDATRALLVDELLGKQEVVIKSLGPTFKDQNLLAGAAVLGDGTVGLILDVDTLVRLPHRRVKDKRVAVV